ncbi:MAG: NADPH-dependent glutamate synthase [Deltaproteobacteria bacterium]|nr:NADPH-dependent glutamate synthase [Deltaproteobacteria bacterium]
MYRIARAEMLAERIFLWEVDAPDVARAAKPGQFIILRLQEGGERIPLTIADFDVARGTVTLVIQALGKTTSQMMNTYKAGDYFEDFVGPLGLESEVEGEGHVVFVAGGLGVAPIFPQLRAFKQAGYRTTAIVGFRNREAIFWEDRFREWADDLIVCTDDGSYGVQGFVTVALAELLQREAPDRVVAVGPLLMMRAVAEVTRPQAVPTVVSLNVIMVDGTGMCGSCRVTVGGKVRFACVEGPEFDAHLVDFDELLVRQRRFEGSEEQAQKDYDHRCHIRDTLFEQGKRNYKKLKSLPPEQVRMPERDPAQRVLGFLEVNLGYTWHDALTEAERCLQCKHPTCIQGCPVSVDIPAFIRNILVHDLEGALTEIHKTNLFPSICGRVCPQEAQCESHCILIKKMEPVAIGRLERFVGDHARGKRARPPAGAGNLGKVAVVGSGPGGLACAADMAKAGAKVTVFEALHVAGGVLSYGIPQFRLPRDTIERELQQLEDLGVEIRTNKVVGKTFTVAQLREEMGYDAVFIATGAGYPKFLGIPGENAGMVYSANEFLTRVNLMGGDRFPLEDTPINYGDRVMVLGAGNTAMDCLRVARRLGAQEVRCVYRRSEAEAPARLEELRHAKEEGVRFHFLHAPVEILLDDRHEVIGLRCQQMELGPPDASGRRSPVPVEGALVDFPCDTVIYALGTGANPIIAQSTPGIATHWGDYLQADPATQATNLEGVFAGGDIVTGGATVILALGAGRRAAAAMEVYLRDGVWPPSLDAVAPLAVDRLVQPTPRRVAQTPVPLDGEGDGLCMICKPVFEWHCQDCHKVYEGFAFPYGRCTSCGGALYLREEGPDLSGDRAQGALQRAMELELGSMAFYKRGARTAKDPDVAELFERLYELERDHHELLRRRYKVESAPPDLDQIPAGQFEHFADYHRTDFTDGQEILRLATRLVERSGRYFEAERASMIEGTPSWQLYAELEAEARDHVAMLETELARYLRGQAGLL